MKIIIAGYGAMGQRVAALAEEKDYEIAGVIVSKSKEIPYPIITDLKNLPEADVLIDFSHPDLTLELLDTEEVDLPLIIATTGEKERIIEKAKIKGKNQPVFFSPNMSYGVYVMTKLVELATELLTNYDIELLEKHHNQKIDAPSGTLDLLLDTIKNVECRKDALPVYDRHDRLKKRDKDEIGVSSIRGGTITGEHDVFFAGLDEEITITHRAQSKDIFANGALNVVPSLIKKDKGYYTFNNL